MRAAGKSAAPVAARAVKTVTKARKAPAKKTAPRKTAARKAPAKKTAEALSAPAPY